MSQKTEMRDAIVWEVDQTNRRAWVKIQGSSQLIEAVLPQNIKQNPTYCRPGAAVTIRHREGRRGYIEIHAEGRAVPQPISETAFPPALCAEDEVVEGLEMFATEPPTMGVYITAGTYRIDCVYYDIDPNTFGSLVMDDPPPIVMGGGQLMGQGAYSVAIAAAPTTSGEARYDLVTIGTGETLNYITGETSTSPVYPEISDGQIQIGYYIYVNYLTTVIESWNLGFTHRGGTPVKLDITKTAISPASFNENGFFEWCESGICASYPNPECYVRVQVLDLYNVPVASGAAGYDFTLAINSGTGQVWSVDDDWNSTSVTKLGHGDSYYDFKYRRIEDDTEYSVVLEANVYHTPMLTRQDAIVLEISGEELRPFQPY